MREKGGEVEGRGRGREGGREGSKCSRVCGSRQIIQPPCRSNTLQTQEIMLLMYVQYGFMYIVHSCTKALHMGRMGTSMAKVLPQGSLQT